MPEQQFILAVDIGTSAARSVLFDEQANLIAQVRQPYPIMSPYQGWSEQKPDQIAQAVIQVIRDGISSLPSPDALAGIVFSSQMYSLLVLDSDGKSLTNSLTWADTRSAAQADRLRADPDIAALAVKTGCPLRSLYPLAKILWFKANLDLPSDARFVSIKDYVIFRLTSQLLTDWSTASASGLLNIAARRWEEDMLAACGITVENLPELVSPRHIVKTWQPDIIQQAGIPPDCPLVMGAGDAPLSSLGAGAIDASKLTVNVGTSAAARVIIPEPDVDPGGRLWTYIADVDRWVMGGIMGSAGSVFDWLLDTIVLTGDDMPPQHLYDLADHLAGSAPPGAEDLIFVPYYSGEQSPGWNPNLRGFMYGMTFQHGKPHIVRAFLEGLTYALLRVRRAVEESQSQSIQEIYLTGGLTTSSVWPQIIADVFGKPAVLPASQEGSARGAAMLGWIALGAADDYHRFQDESAVRIFPNSENHALYQERYRLFCSLVEHISSFSTAQER